MLRVLGRAFILLGLTAMVASAAEPLTAAEISRRSREKGALNLVGLVSELKLVTVAKDGRTREQSVRSEARSIDGRVHSLARFLAPAGVAGVTVLTVEGRDGKASDISLYLPKLRRVRKVASSQRGQAFMDTDFNYADLGGAGDLRDDGLERLADATVDGRAVYVLSGVAGKDSPYGRVTVYVDQQTDVPLKAEYADRENRPFKEYRALKLQKFQGRVLAAESQMENLQTGSKTRLTILKLDASRSGDEDFTERALERG